MAKVPVPIDKRQWHPSLLPGPIALVTTVDASGTANLAPKSWIQMVSFEPSILMFSGDPQGRTEKNAIATGCFAINLVDASLVRRAIECARWSGQERIDQSGFRLVPASSIESPLVDDCKVHIECRVHVHHAVGALFVVYGQIVAASICETILEGAVDERYARFAQAMFLEEGRHAIVSHALPSSKQASESGEFQRFVYLLSHARSELFCEALVREHVEHLKRIDDAGNLELCGPFADYRGGMVILRGVTAQQARAIAESDPFVTSGAETYELRTLDLSARENDHMGMG